MRNLLLKLRRRRHQDQESSKKKTNKEGESSSLTSPPSLTTATKKTTTGSSSKSSSVPSSASSVVTTSSASTTTSTVSTTSKTFFDDPHTPQQNTCRQLLHVMNQHDVEFYQFFHLGMKIWFGDHMGLDVPVFFDVLRLTYQSFPDFRFDVNSMEQVSETTVKLVVTVTATHTGVPYRTPQFTTPLPTSGLRVQNDPEEWTIVFSGQRIREQRIRALGKYSGPNGLYMRIQEATAAQPEQPK